MQAHWSDYNNAKFNPVFTAAAGEKMLQKYLGQNIKFEISEFYNALGNSILSLYELTSQHPPGTTFEENYISKGCWKIEGGHLLIDGGLYEIKGIEYEVPYVVTNDEIVIEAKGNPKIFIRDAKGHIDKLLTDKDLKKVRFNNGNIEVVE